MVDSSLDRDDLKAIEQRLEDDDASTDCLYLGQDVWWHDSDEQMKLRPSDVRKLIKEIKRLNGWLQP